MPALPESDLRKHLRPTALAETGSWRSPAVILFVTIILAVVLKPLLAPQLTPALVFVLGITLIGANSGLVPGFITSILAAAIFNFFLTEPVLSFRMSTIGDLTPPVIFIACAVVSGLLSGRLKEKTSQLGRTNLQLESLLETSRTLQAAPDADAIVTALGASVPGRLGFRLSLYGMKGGKPDALASADHSPDALNSAAKAIAGERVVRAGNTITFRLDGSRSRVGALVIENTGEAHVDEAFLEGLASLVGLAFERAQFASMIAEAEVNVRTEELKSALLSSVSHDLRTPITAISASASSLIEYGGHLDSETSQSLLQGIVDECDRLNRFTANLLELSRLQAGGPGIAGQVLSVHDVVRSVVQRLRARFPGREINLSAKPPEILVLADTALFELALINVIQNALIYSEPESPVTVQSTFDRDACCIRVTDRGSGIPASEQDKVFNRFYRAKRNEASPQGSGLGLAIAKGFVEAFDGAIELTSPVLGGKGTTVTITLPIVEEAKV